MSAAASSGAGATASELIRLSAADLASKLASGEVSSVEATQAHLDRIAAVDGDVHAFLHISADALATAERIDQQRAAGDTLGPLAGVPVAIKDVLCTLDMPSTAGSKILEGWIPPYDATTVARLRAAGLVPLGKTNMDEFAMGSSTEHSAYGPTKNPWDLTRIPGGSGGGSAAAVAAFEAPLALGSDTGGSIRQPAAVTGSVGVKPTYGGVSRYGAIALASSLDQVGPVTRTVLDAGLLHDVIGGHDPRDSTSLKDVWPSFADAARAGARAEPLKGLRVGVSGLRLRRQHHAVGVLDVLLEFFQRLALAHDSGHFLQTPHEPPVVNPVLEGEVALHSATLLSP